MAIAFDATAIGTDQDSSSNTWSHTCTGSNRLLIVVTYTGQDADLVSGVTYNGVAMTSFGTVANGNLTYGRTQHLWYLKNPSLGSNTVSLTVSTGANVIGVSMSYTGVSQIATFPDASGSGTYPAAGAGNPYSPTPNVTTSADNCWIFVSMSSHFNTLSTGGTSRQATGNGILFADSNAAKTPAGNYTISVTNSTNAAAQGLTGSFAPFVPLPDIGFSVSDNVNVSESVTATNATLKAISVSDQLNITETILVLKFGDTIVSDQVNITESVTMSTIQLVGINVFDRLNITENFIAEPYSVNVFDVVQVNESISIESFKFSPAVDRPLGSGGGSFTPVGSSANFD